MKKGVKRTLSGRGLSILALSLNKDETKSTKSQSPRPQKRLVKKGVSPQKNIFVRSPVESFR